MTPNAYAFDNWIRTGFIEINTALEELYFAQENKANTIDVGIDLKQQLVNEGQHYIQALLREGNTDEGFDAGFDLLDNVGLYMGACRRHEISESEQSKNASALALQLGASLGVTPRFATSHLTTHNFAQHGVYKAFTSLQAEAFFLEYNTRGIFAYKRAADSLVRILPIGISHPVACDLLAAATQAIENVIENNNELFSRLDVDRFFYNVRPYYKPYKVGQQEYRGANAGDFAGINELDVLLGLCQPESPHYSQLLVDKFLFMMPEDQARLRDCMRRKSLLDQLLEEIPRSQAKPWFTKVVQEFLNVCHAHGEAASQHHHQLVEKYITKPSEDIDQQYLEKITASGPPLDVLLRSLNNLKDLRIAAKRDDIPSRYADLERLRTAINTNKK